MCPLPWCARLHRLDEHCPHGRSLQPLRGSIGEGACAFVVIIIIDYFCDSLFRCQLFFPPPLCFIHCCPMRRARARPSWTRGRWCARSSLSLSSARTMITLIEQPFLFASFHYSSSFFSFFSLLLPLFFFITISSSSSPFLLFQSIAERVWPLYVYYSESFKGEPQIAVTAIQGMGALWIAFPSLLPAASSLIRLTLAHTSPAPLRIHMCR